MARAAAVTGASERAQELIVALNAARKGVSFVNTKFLATSRSPRYQHRVTPAANLVEYRLGPQESLLAMRADANVAVVITDRNLLGLSPFTGGFFSTDFHLRERLERISLAPSLATVTTNRRYLVFRADSKIWTERKRTLKG